jgi:hypothetical protein
MTQMDHVQQTERACPTCFSTTKFPGTVIEANGRCNHCNTRDFEAVLHDQTTSDLSALRAVAEEIKKKRVGRYDCVIGASGGFDSSYIIYVAKKLLGLNPLVVKYDHGFNYEIADRNLHTLCGNLGVDLQYVRSKKARDLKFIRATARALKDIDLYWGVCNFCRHAGGSVVLRAAFDNGIPVILEAVNKFEKHNFLSGRVKLKLILKRLSRLSPLKWPRIPFWLAVGYYHLLRFRMELYVPPLGNLFKPFPQSKKVSKVCLSTYLKWDIYAIAELLKRETGWTCLHPEMPMRFDCQIEDSIFNYTFKQATGATTHTIICNNLIYGGVKQKEDLAAVVEYHDRILVQKTEDMKRRLGIGSKK